VREVEFHRFLDDDNALRVKFEIERGQVIKFMVQLESQFDETWIPVVRYDTAHGFAHCDVIHPYEDTVKTKLEIKSYGEALTFAIDDLSKNWKDYQTRYEKWLKKK